jgi:acyl-CoA synthetase (AMP-forming)/AMP-acid ligase II
MNVYPAEVEAALATLPGVAECAVLGLPDEHWGEAVTEQLPRNASMKVRKDQLREQLTGQPAGEGSRRA